MALHFRALTGRILTERKNNARRKDAEGKHVFRCGVVFLCAVYFLLSARLVWADGGDVNNPDLQVNGFAVFGTNAAGATSVTSGWGNVYIEHGAEIGSNLVIHGPVRSMDMLRMNTYRLDQTTQILTGLTAIQPTSSYIRVQGSAGNVSMLADPQIAAGDPGQILTLQGTANDRMVRIQDGAGVQTQFDLPFSLGLYDILQLIYDDSSGNWVEINRSNNRSTN